MTLSKFSTGEEYAIKLDEEDPLFPYRDRFHLPLDSSQRPLLYFAGNSLGLLPKGVREAILEEISDWGDQALAAHFEGKNPWYSYHEAFSDVAAKIVGARPGEVVLMNSLTVNLHLMMVSFYRPTRGRHQILIEQHAFPSDRYAAESQIRCHGFDPETSLRVAAPRPGEAILRIEDLENLLEKEGESIALVLFPGVNYYSGQAFEMERIARKAREVGAAVGFDLAHAAGNFPLDLHRWGPDFAVWCSYKYLNSGPGSVGGCFVHERHADAPRLPRLAGWWGNDPATRFSVPEYFRPQPGAAGWQLSNAPIFGMAPCRVSLPMFVEAGMEKLREKSVRLTAYLEYLLDQIPGQPFTFLTPRDPSRRGCQLSLRLEGKAREIFRALQARGVVCDVREPDVIRVAPVPLYNTFHDVWRLGRILSELLAS